MVKQIRDMRTLALVMGLFTIVWLFIVPQVTRAYRPDANSATDELTDVPDAYEMPALAVDSSETWRLGITSEGDASYGAIICRNVSDVAAFRSDRDSSDFYYVFPAPSSQRTVKAARMHILERNGAYAAGSATLTLEIIDFAGTVQHTVSASVIDLLTAATGTWSDVTLSGDPANLEIASGEFLAVHFALSGGPAGDLDVRPIFEVDVE